MKVRNENSLPQISWKEILSSLEDGVITVDLEGKIAFFNEPAEVLTGISASRALQHSFIRLFKQEPWLLELLKKSGPPRHENVRAEGDLLTRSGRKVPISAAASPLQDASGSFLGNILLIRDLAYRKELEEDLKRADRLAMMGTVAAGLAHEIRNPLGGIKGAAQMLRRSFDKDSPLVEYTNIMVREVDRVAKLIDQLLDLSQPAELKLSPVNIHEVLEDVLLLEEQAVERKNKRVIKRFDPSLPPIRGDKGQLTQVFLNLVKNAFQAMTEADTLTITSRVETDFHIRDQGAARSKFIWVDIEDQGSGIKEEDLARIFSPYFTTKNDGAGLGLAVCYRIIKEHGGLIRVESTQGAGTTFRVSLIVAE